MNRVFLFVLLALSNIVTGQDLSTYSSKYEGYLSVYTREEQHFVIDIKADTLYITDTHKEEMFHLSDKSNVFSTRSIPYSFFFKLGNINARSLIPTEKGKLKTLVVKDFTDKSDQSAEIFYNDYRYKSFIYPNIGAGTRTSLEYVQEVLEPKLLPGFYLQRHLPVEEGLYTIKVHKDVVLKYKMFNTDKFDITFSEEVKGNYRTYFWKIKNMPGYERESDAPGVAYYLPHIQFYIHSYKSGGKEKKVLSSLDDLYGWYASLTQHIRDESADDVLPVVKSIVAESDSELDKVKKIFYWVQDNIKYVAFEDGMRGFVPHHGTLTMSNRYGDCKDMASLLYLMLKAVGIDSYLTWIGTIDLPYSYHELHTPAVDNHMILTYVSADKKYYFLDPTSSYHNFDLPSSHIQGKEALIGLSDKEYEVKKVPIVHKDLNLYTDSLFFKISNNDLVGSGRTTINGFPKMMTTYALSGKTKEKEEKNLRAMLEKGGNKFFLKNYKIEHLDNKDKPFEVAYDCVLEGYLKRYEDEIYLNLNLDRTFANSEIQGDRKLPIKAKYTLKSENKTIVEIPKDYKIDHLPENSTFEHEHFGFNIRYSVVKNRVIQEKTMYVNYMVLEPELFPEWNAFVKQVNKAYRDVVSLKKK